MSGGPDVLHVITTFDRGGAEGHLLELMRAQRESGMRVAVAWVRGRGYWRFAAEEAGIVCHPLSEQPGLAREEPFPGPTAVRRLATLLRARRGVLVHAHLQPAECYLEVARRLAGHRGPLVVTRHNTDPFWPGHPRRSRWLARWLGRRVDHLIAISRAAAATARDEGLPGRVPLTVIPYGIDPGPIDAVAPDAVPAWRRATGLPEDGVVVLALARMVRQKALDTLIAAFAEAAGAPGGASLHLLLAGTGPLEAELRAQAAATGLGERIRFLGFREDAPLLLRAADVIALPSEAEGFGRVLLEAMAAARPVVGSRVDGIAEIVVDGTSGVLVPPRDVEALAEALVAMTDADRRARLGAGARARLGEHTVAAMARATVAVYTTVR